MELRPGVLILPALPFFLHMSTAMPAKVELVHTRAPFYFCHDRALKPGISQ